MADNKTKRAKSLQTAVDYSSKFQHLEDEVHNVKTVNYINLAILAVLLAFVIGIVAKQLGF